MSPQQVGVPWLPENMVTPTCELLTTPLSFAASYMSRYWEWSEMNGIPWTLPLEIALSHLRLETPGALTGEG
jgi:hypothetical protein